MIPLRVARTIGAVVVVPIFMTACEGLTIRNCDADWNDAAANTAISVYMLSPYRCQFTVKVAGGQFELLAEFVVQSNWSFYVNQPTYHRIWPKYASGFQPQGSGPLLVFWKGATECGSNTACFTINAFWYAATGDDENGVYTDQYRVQGETPNGNATLAVDFTGIVGGYSDIVGPTAFTGGSVQTWRATVVGDTLSYQYQWLVNGVPVPAEHGRSFHSDLSMLESGSHSITGIAQLMDQTTDTVTKSVSLSMGAGWTGPTVLAPYETGTWNGFAYSGRDPISCQWWVDGAAEPGSTCSLSRSFEPNTTHNLALYVTDARSITAYGGDWPVHVTSGPECCDEVRVPSETKRPRRSGVNSGRP